MEAIKQYALSMERKAVARKSREELYFFLNQIITAVAPGSGITANQLKQAIIDDLPRLKRNLALAEERF